MRDSKGVVSQGSSSIAGVTMWEADEQKNPAPVSVVIFGRVIRREEAIDLRPFVSLLID
jgi:hypothetical protein